LVVFHLLVCFHDANVDSREVNALLVLDHLIVIALLTKHLEVLLQERQRFLSVFVLALYVVQQSQLMAGVCMRRLIVTLLCNLNHLG
jgi:hypothetical protein